MTHHTLRASPATCRWGIFDGSYPPVLEIASGDTITIETVSGGRGRTPAADSGFFVPPELLEIQETLSPPLGGGHILTGPVAVEGAVPGDVLEVRIREVELRQDWGYNIILPLEGALPEDFPEGRMIHIPLDRARNVARLPWGGELALSPFFGVIGTAPPPSWGGRTSLVPRAFGGNLDNKELVAGSTLYLPVFVDGGCLSVGDGHGAQGDGEVCVSAIETALRGTFEIHLRKDLRLEGPEAETPTHHITMATDPDLDVAMKTALRRMLRLIQDRAGLSAFDAYTLCSLAADLRITQVVNQHKGVHVMLAKARLQR